MDNRRAREIITSPETIQVLYQDTPVWLVNVKDNNVVEVSRPGGQGKMNVPVYMLVENNPAAK
jgi:H-type small acid-soluble spore protein